MKSSFGEGEKSLREANKKAHLSSLSRSRYTLSFSVHSVLNNGHILLPPIILRATSLKRSARAMKTILSVSGTSLIPAVSLHSTPKMYGRAEALYPLLSSYDGQSQRQFDHVLESFGIHVTRPTALDRSNSKTSGYLVAMMFTGMTPILTGRRRNLAC